MSCVVRPVVRDRGFPRRFSRFRKAGEGLPLARGLLLTGLRLIEGLGRGLRLGEGLRLPEGLGVAGRTLGSGDLLGMML